MKKVLYILTTTLFLPACQGQETNSTMGNADNTSFPVQKTEQEWKAQLSAEEYFVIPKKEPNAPTPVNTTCTLTMVPTRAVVAAPHSSPRTQNLIRTVVGLPLTRASLKALY